MEDLIKALQIFLKYGYGNSYNPTNCSHGVLYVDIQPEKVSDEDIDRLEKLSFFPADDFDGFISYRFGSC